MAKTLILFSLFLGILNCSLAQKISTIFSHEMLLGNVKQVVEIDYKKNNKNTKVDSLGKTISKYNSTGKLTETDIYLNVNNRLYLFAKSFFQQIKDSIGNVYSFKTNDKKGMTIIYKFNEKGFLTEMDNPLNKMVYKYDKNDNQVLMELHGNNGDILSKQKYKYDKTGNIIEEYEYVGDVNYSLVTIYYTYQSFDNNGNWLKRTITGVSRKGTGDKPLVTIAERQITYY